MPTLRSPIKRRANRRITDEAVEAFRAGHFHRLHRALGLRPWEESPLNVEREQPPDWMTGALQRANWRISWELRRELEKAAEQ